jgi:ubiquinone/menaquinone biosynthesis C-methylase UbiE
VDFSPTAVATANRRLSTLERGGAVIQVSTLVLSFPAESFAVVYSNGVLRILEAEVVVREMLRVSRPGGRIVAMRHHARSVNRYVTIGRVSDTTVL